MNDIKTKFSGIVLTIPSVIIVLILFVIPFIISFIGSFQLKSGEFGLGNYVEAFKIYNDDMLYTIIISILSLVILIIITAIIAGYLRLYQAPLVEFIFKIPLFVPYVVVGHAMRIFLAPHGTLNSILAMIGFINPDNLPSIAYNSLGLIVALVWKQLGISLLIVLGSFRAINNERLETAQIMGASKWLLIKDFLIPMSKNAFGVVAILSFSSFISSFSIPSMIGSTKNYMIMIDIYQQINILRNKGLANALGVFTYVLSIGTAIYYLRKGNANNDNA